MTNHQNTQRVYRVDRFKVPGVARDEFLQRVQMTHDSLRSVTGFVQDFILEQSSGPSAFNFVTIVIWESAGVLDVARAAVVQLHKEMGFDPREMFARLGIEADLATYAEASPT